MTSDSELNSPEASVELREALWRLLALIKEASLKEALLLRIETEAPSLSGLEWLASLSESSRYYWRDRRAVIEMAGVGEADILDSHEGADMEEVLRQLTAHLHASGEGVRYYGGFRFHADTTRPGPWMEFQAHRFIVPLLEYFRSARGSFLAVTLKSEAEREGAMALITRILNTPPRTVEPLPSFTHCRDIPDLCVWKQQIEDALQAFEKGPLTKVVLARESSFQASAPIDPLALLQKLSGQAPDTTLFCFQPVPTRAFLGASPERLYCRAGLRFQTEALAGTRPRGPDEEEDTKLAEELLNSDKEQREHAIVVDSLLSSLDRFTSEVQYPGAAVIRKLGYCQHLHTPITALLREGVSDYALLRKLHPTPAVGGHPQKEAVRYILETETFERGIFAAPVGWLARDSADFCVGIRSAAVLEDRLSLYAGAGIVPHSNAEEEWAELDAKMRQFLKIMESPSHGI
ncbi:MAG: isochorismate synthase [Candidatus Hydrogenedens sp.]|jgi:menaquinone-specific isochorismate synthase|nr:isochorismate synthase [Candidatus Hydrogenedens sp.]